MSPGIFIFVKKSMIKFEAIASVSSAFPEKFGIPRQAGLCPSAAAFLEFPNTNFYKDALKDLEGFSHLWVIFYFHSLKKTPDKAKIRPPRLGGNKYVGVFSSRSPYRPNPIGLSLVENAGLEVTDNHLRLHIRNHDLLDGTPVLDLKPYISHDRPGTSPAFGWQTEPWTDLEVTFSNESDSFLKDKEELKNLIIDVLKNNPAPAYIKNSENDRIYGMKLNNFNIHFKTDEQHCLVLKITP